VYLDKSAIDEIRQIYREARILYDDLSPQLGAADCGYSILYAPPRLYPDLFIVGLQPGGACKSVPDGADESPWPLTSYYAGGTEEQRDALPSILQKTFPLKILEECCGINAIFLRSPNMKTYHQLSETLVKPFENFSRFSLETIIRMSMPRCILFLGFSAFKMLTGRDGERKVTRSNGHRLLDVSTYLDIPAFIMAHPTSGRVRVTIQEMQEVAAIVTNFIDHRAAASS
jgi:hypothetical protein